MSNEQKHIYLVTQVLYSQKTGKPVTREVLAAFTKPLDAEALVADTPRTLIEDRLITRRFSFSVPLDPDGSA